MKKLLSLLVAAVFALSLSFAALAEDKKPADKPPAASTTKKKSKKTAEEKKAAGDEKKAEADAAKGAKK